MRIIVLSQTLPFPFNKNGFTVPISRWIKGLASEGNIIDLIYFDNKKYENNLELKNNLLINDIYFIKNPQKIKNNFIKILSLFQKYPTYIWNTYDIKAGKEIEKVINSKKYDMVLIAGIQISNYYMHFGDLKKVLIDLDSHYLLYKRRYTNEKGLKKLGLKLQLQKIMKFESELYKKYEARILLSVYDKEIAQKLDPKLNIYVVPLGTEIRATNTQEKNTNIINIIFVGNLSYYPNEEAAIYFANMILPILEKENKNKIIFSVIGKNPNDKIIRLQSNNIIITGEVSDVTPYYNKADIVVAPLLTGSGIKNKVLEAMAHKKCVITTDIGVEGLEVENNKDIIWCKSKEEMIKAVNKVIKDIKARNDIAKNGFKKVAENYTWDISIKKFNDVMYQIKNK